MTPRALAALLAPLVLCTACDEFATPAELESAQILAIRADPPAVPPGQDAVITILVADNTGAVDDPDVAWEVTATNAASLPLGQVSRDGSGQVIYSAPSDVPEQPAIASITARVRTAERELVGVKVVGITDIPLSNPDIIALTGDGDDLLSSDGLSLAPGRTVTLEITTDPPAGDTATYAWYSTAGTMERFQENPVELVARDDAGPGWLFAVVRDGLGGVDWVAVPVTVE